MGDVEPMRERKCGHCKGRGYCHHTIDPDWCCECGGGGAYMTPVLPVGASARLGRAITMAVRRG